MSRIRGPALFSAIGIVLLVALFFGLPYLKDKQQKATSDARKIQGKIRIANDNWLGYFPLCRSSEMKMAMRQSGWLLDCQDDKANYSERMKKLNDGEYDLIVATVDSYVLNAEKHKYPGTVIMVIDESKGGDAVLAWKDKTANLDELKGKSDIKVAFTPNSPSHHLAKAAVAHFNVRELLPEDPNLRKETNGSEEARELLLSKKADVAILWEPDVSKALANPGIVKLIGTEDTEKVIVDILVVNRKYAENSSKAVSLLLTNYFKVLKIYRDNPSLLFAHIKDETGISDKKVIDDMLKGIKFVNFTENCEQWFGVPEGMNEGLVNTIESTITILKNAKDFPNSPIPDEDPYRIINSSFLRELYAKGITGFTTPKPGGIGIESSIEARFDPLDEAGWNALKDVGTLKVGDINFQSGSADLDNLTKVVVEEAGKKLEHYPNFRVIIKGHTGIKGDPEQNKILSKERADAVARHLQITFNIDLNRLHTIGFGGEKQLPMKQGESKREWMYRLPRVELVLAREEY